MQWKENLPKMSEKAVRQAAVGSLGGTVKSETEKNSDRAHVGAFDEEKKKKLLGMLGLAVRARKTVFGVDAIVDKIRFGNSVCLVVIASDVSQNTKKRIVNTCKYYETDCVVSNASQSELSDATGKTSNVSAVAIIDRNFAAAVKKLV